MATKVIESPSKRTAVTVDMKNDGSFEVYADRDGRRVHYHSDSYEQGGPDSPPGKVAK